MSSKIKELFKDKDRRRGLIGTTVVHLLLLVALLILALRTPLPLPGEEGVEVNLGYNDQGLGDIQSETPAPVAQPVPQPPQQQPEVKLPEPVVEEEEIITQEVEEAPVIEEEIKEEPPEKEEEEPKINVDEVTSVVQKDVSIVTILDLHQKTNN